MYLKFKDKDTIYFKDYGVWDDNAKKEAFNLIHSHVKSHVRRNNVLWMSKLMLNIDFSYLNEGKEKPVYEVIEETNHSKLFTYEGYNYRFEYDSGSTKPGEIRLRSDDRIFVKHRVE